MRRFFKDRGLLRTVKATFLARMVESMRFLLLLASAAALAQDPYKVAPRVYQKEFENAWVRVSRVSYQPGDKVPVHDHPAIPTVYVYVTDGGPIHFGHQEFSGITRSAVLAGQIRFNRGNKETHTTEYRGDQPSEYLRIELKTKPDGPPRDARIAPDDMTPFENKQVRIARVTCSPCEVASTPMVVVLGKKAQWVEAGAVPPEGSQIQVQLLSKP